MADKSSPKSRYWRIGEVCRISRYSRAHLYRLIAQGDFPAGFKVGRGRTGRRLWTHDEIDQWQSDKENNINRKYGGLNDTKY